MEVATEREGMSYGPAGVTGAGSGGVGQEGR